MQNNQKIIGIFGAGGFLGRHIMRQLTKLGYRVKVATRNPYLKPKDSNDNPNSAANKLKKI